MAVFHNLFSNDLDVFAQYNVPESDRQGIKFLYAAYEYEDYNGTSAVIFLQNGKLYWNSGSHCSCYGLEDQWDPEELTIPEIKHYLKHNTCPYGIDFQVFRETFEAIEQINLETMTSDQIALILRLAQ